MGILTRILASCLVIDIFISGFCTSAETMKFETSVETFDPHIEIIETSDQVLAEIAEIEGSGAGASTTSSNPITGDIEGSGTAESTTSLQTTNIISTSTTQGASTSNCQNGGHFNGNNCVCKPNFEGRLCEFIRNEIIPEASVNVTVSVENVNFTEKLQDFTSKEFKDFEAWFIKKMKLVYEQVTNYRGVRIISIREGSVVVEHLIILQVTIDEYDEDVRTVKTLLDRTACTSEEDDKLCLKAGATKVQSIPPDITGICLNLTTLPEEVRQYYHPADVSGVMKCVSGCSPYSNMTIDCNTGQCSVNKKGPHCYCETTSDYWYTGDLCQTAISKPGVYGGVAVGLFMLLVAFIIMAIMLYRRRNVSDKENLLEDDKIQWYEEGWEEDNRGSRALHSYESVQGSKGSDFQPSLARVNPKVNMALPRPDYVPHRNPS